jgi:hypothetical protein
MIDKVMNTLSRAVMYLILLVKIKLIKLIVAEPPPLTSILYDVSRGKRILW